MTTAAGKVWDVGLEYIFFSRQVVGHVRIDGTAAVVAAWKWDHAAPGNLSTPGQHCLTLPRVSKPSHTR
jgi:hypothetical protein